MTDDMVWEDPPRERAGRGAATVDHPATAAALRGRPGVWGVVAEYPNQNTSSSIAWHIRTAKNIKAYAPAGSFEAMARSVDQIEDGQRVRHHRVYARFVGQADDE